MKAAVAYGQTSGSHTSYGANGQVFGTITTSVVNGQPTINKWGSKGGTKVPRDIPDGTSNTIFWIEKLAWCTGGNILGGSQWAAGNGNSIPLIGESFTASGQDGTALSPNLVLTYFNIANAPSCYHNQPASSHTGAMLAALGDGSVRILNQGMAQLTFNIAMVPNDGLPLGPDW